jgi:hypothetical protein
MKKIIMFFIAFVAFTSLKAQNSPSQPEPTTNTAPAKATTNTAPAKPAEGATPQNNPNGGGTKEEVDKISGGTKPDKQRPTATAKTGNN